MSFSISENLISYHKNFSITTIKAGKGNELWNDKPNKKRHKDIDARWTKKNKETFYGYKDHAKVDAKSKFTPQDNPIKQQLHNKMKYPTG